MGRRGNAGRDVALAAAASALPDRMFFGVIDWHYRYQRPQHLAVQFAARGRRVFYFSSEFVDNDAPGFDAEALDPSGGLMQIRLHLRGAHAIYFHGATRYQTRQLRAGLELFAAWAEPADPEILIQHPYWFPVIAGLGRSLLVYDCMDYHEGFDAFSKDLQHAEHGLFRMADITVVTSVWLESYARRYAARTAVIRNGVDYAFFSARPDSIFQDPEGRRVLGYYGEIGEWFDANLVASVASAFPDCLVLLIGNDSGCMQKRLRKHENVRFMGEVPYQALPFYLYGFDVCMLPFQVTPLTLATNPVKLYEYLAAGNPVVSVPIPEAKACADYIWVAEDVAAFSRAIGDALSADGGLQAQRQAFAAKQTWRERARHFDAVVETTKAETAPVVSGAEAAGG